MSCECEALIGDLKEENAKLRAKLRSATDSGGHLANMVTIARWMRYGGHSAPGVPYFRLEPADRRNIAYHVGVKVASLARREGVEPVAREVDDRHNDTTKVINIWPQAFLDDLYEEGELRGLLA